MNRGKKLLVGICVVAVITAGGKLAWEMSDYAPKTTRYKITVTVDTPEGPRSGSSVLEFRTEKHLKLLPNQRRYTETMRGEAVAVDLPGNQTLFALLKQDGTRSIGELIGRTFYPNGRENAPEWKAGDPPLAMNRHLVIGGRTLAEPGIPMLVSFHNIDDPQTVQKVDPENLALIFGDSVRLHSITLQITNADIDFSIDKKLKWLFSHRSSLKRNPPETLTDPSDPDLRLLGTGSFSTEIVRHES